MDKGRHPKFRVKSVYELSAVVYDFKYSATGAAYNRAIQQFLTWAEPAGYQDLEDIEPITG